ncbi:MAG TPA: hypothetical protein VEI01_19270 [Terriglobales bacterium]|nr:hypothetical protein [Terriglobales bacterium]
MPHVPRVWPLFAVLACPAVSIAAQQPAVPPAPMQPPAAQAARPESTPTVDNEFIQKQFGEEFTLVPMSAPFVRDIDGDGVDDLVIVARSKKPMIDAAEHSYKVVDPYYSFYGYGDPKLTSTFGAEDPMEKNLVVLVIHGAGPEAWRSETPKSKFVIINLPFKRIAVRRLQKGKKMVNAIFAMEADASAGDSAVFWDGKTYKYEPIGTGGD